ATNHPRQPFQTTAAWDESNTDLGLAEHRALPAGKAHVAGQHELVADPTRAAAYLGDAHDGRGRQAQHQFSPKVEHLWPLGRLSYVEMGDEKFGISRLEHYDPYGRVRLDILQQICEFDDRVGKEHIDRRIVENDSPQPGITSLDV